MATFFEVCAAPASSYAKTTTRAGFTSVARLLVAAVLIPQLPITIWWVATRSLLYQRGWLNLEYMGLLCIGILWPSWWTVSLLTVEMCLALVQPIASLYYFHMGDVPLSLRYMLLLPPHRLLEYGLLLLAYVMFCAIVLRWALGERRYGIAGRSVAVICLCSGVAIASSLTIRGHTLRPRWRTTDLRSGRIPSVPLISLVDSVHVYRHESLRGPGRIPLTSTLTAAIGSIPTDTSPNVVLVLTESWGLAQDDRINRAERGPYDAPSIAALYSESTGSVSFDGATTSGETRALCGDAEGIASISEPSPYFAKCWPSKLDHLGYQTVAVHGFTPTMFQRARWYTEFGFARTVFQPQLQRDGGAMCDGAFPGICDADVAQWIGEHLLARTADRPAFVHWVTLGSHLPVPPENDPSNLQACARVGIADENALCSWFNLVLRLHQSVAKLALSPMTRPTVFVIVGDHAPPFLNADIRARFSQTSVPYVILTPRTLISPPNLQPLHAAIQSAPLPGPARKVFRKLGNSSPKTAL